MLIVGGTAGEEGTRDLGEWAVPCVQLFCKPKTALLKKLVYSLKEIWLYSFSAKHPSRASSFSEKKKKSASKRSWWSSPSPCLQAHLPLVHHHYCISDIGAFHQFSRIASTPHPVPYTCHVLWLDILSLLSHVATLIRSNFVFQIQRHLSQRGVLSPFSKSNYPTASLFFLTSLYPLPS